MPQRRALSLWFPRLGAERLMRLDRGRMPGPFAVVEDQANMQVLSSLSAEAEAEGLRPGQPMRDAMAMCPELRTRPRNPHAEAMFLLALRRWAGKFSPWVADQPPGSLLIDLTGCAHLFGGELAVVDLILQDCADMGLTVCPGIADTPGGAWALARFAGQGPEATRSGDAVDQEARATRARAVKRRHWERGGQPPRAALPDLFSPPGEDEVPDHPLAGRVAPPGKLHLHLGPLPVAALRLAPDMAADLNRLGLRRVSDLIGTPRAPLARRFGADLVRRLDQALGMVPEPISPARPDVHFAVRLTLPEPIGLESDVLAALDRLLPPLSERLKSKGRGARRVRVQAIRTDGSSQWAEVGLAAPSADPDRIRPLVAMKITEFEAGFGFDTIRLEAPVTEPVHAQQHRGHLDAAAEAMARQSGRIDTAMDDLIGRIGARIGLEAITRLYHVDTHIPEKASRVMAAAWSQPALDWPEFHLPRPLRIWRPEPVMAEDRPAVPTRFRWRRRPLTVLSALGPERIAPEWWLDDPNWRSGTRDYWRITATTGERLWLFYAHGGTMSSGWFCQGAFA